MSEDKHDQFNKKLKLFTILSCLFNRIILYETSKNKPISHHKWRIK